MSKNVVLMFMAYGGD